MKENEQIITEARNLLEGKWLPVAGTFLVYFLIVVVGQSIPFLGFIFSILVTGAFSLGMAIYLLAIVRNEQFNINQIFDGFKDFERSLKTYLLLLFHVIIRLLLLIVPGIIAAFGYSLTYFILADDSKITPKEALEKSKQMMDGYKWKLFYLYCRFIGWTILCAFTLGLGIPFLMAYIYVSMAIFYEDVKLGNNSEPTENSFIQRN